MKNKELLIYRIVTVLFSLLIMLGVSQYFFNYEMVKGMFEQLHFPSYLIYPMGVMKTLGVIAIWVKVPKTIKEWAYAGFAFNLLLGISAHLNVADGEYYGALIALILASISYFYYRKVNVAVA
ncbi:DoxX family protein [Sediminitomix flava]|uniref:DoxX-like protein n=1 Tax=Sediminitomix flava TaxID=379075 RepID=A0A315ZE13_SEDFL|nr:DoxX family protein [Sediminitomix flava]PWJ43856.1 DoxX-like protein [Sediminitomix flava]